jgi:DNA-directed RNA polymerase subunit M/transcription elongation factor TFIIS
MKKRCKACGNLVIVAVNQHGITPSPISCATCKSLGVEKAIEERLKVRLSNPRTKLEINSAKEFDELQYKRQLKQMATSK